MELQVLWKKTAAQVTVQKLTISVKYQAGSALPKSNRFAFHTSEPYKASGSDLEQSNCVFTILGGGPVELVRLPVRRTVHFWHVP